MSVFLLRLAFYRCSVPTVTRGCKILKNNLPNGRPYGTHNSKLKTHLSPRKIVRQVHSPFTIHHSPFTTHTIHHSPFTIHHSPFTIHHSPFTIHHSPFTTHHSPLTIHLSPFTFHLSRFTTHDSL